MFALLDYRLAIPNDVAVNDGNADDPMQVQCRSFADAAGYRMKRETGIFVIRQTI